MNLHSLQNHPGAKKRPMRVGRGKSSGKGGTSGRGHKGQMSRSGSKRRPLKEGGQMPLIRRIPKRGFTSPNRVEYVGLNLGELVKLLPGDITPEALVAAGRVSARDRIKVLGSGDITEARNITAHAFSATARAKIEQAGGSCEVMSQSMI